jgi:modulator of FtsH protease HflC
MIDKNKIKLYLIVAALTLFLGLNSLYITDERQIALVFQFGELVRVNDKPGLSIKVPFIQNLSYLDKRLLNFNSSEKEVTALDQKKIIVNFFAKYKIVDPRKFYQTVTTEEGAKSRLNSIIDSSMRQVLGKVPFSELLTPRRSGIMKDIQNLASTEVKRFGIEVTDVRIMRADLPEENSQAIYNRMRTDREKEAKQYRAEGAEESDRVRADADRERKILIADAYKKADILRGEGESESTEIYAKSFSKDPEFYNFYRSLQAYKNSISKEDTKLLLSPDSGFLKFFKE